MATPTFTNLDIGLPGGTLNPAQAQTLCSVKVGPLQKAWSTFAFAGFKGMFPVAMGPQTRLITWTIVLRCDGLTTLKTIESNIEALIGVQGTLTDSVGKSHTNTIVLQYRRQGP